MVVQPAVVAAECVRYAMMRCRAAVALVGSKTIPVREYAQCCCRCSILCPMSESMRCVPLIVAENAAPWWVAAHRSRVPERSLARRVVERERRTGRRREEGRRRVGHPLERAPM